MKTGKGEIKRTGHINHLLIALLCLLVMPAFAGCGSGEAGAEGGAAAGEDAAVRIFAAEHLRAPLEELEKSFEAAHPEVDVICTFDDAEKLQERIEAGEDCDVFFSDAQAPMDALQSQDLLVQDSRKNVINDQLVLVVKKGSGEENLQLASLSSAGSLALIQPAVSAGEKTCLALARSGYLDRSEDMKAVSAETIAQGTGVDSVSVKETPGDVLSAVEDGSCEAGIVQLSDIYGHEDAIKIVEAISYDLTGSMFDCLAATSAAGDPGAAEDDGSQVKESVQQVLDYLSGQEAASVYDSYFLSTDLSAGARPWQRKACPCCNGVLPQGEGS